MYREIPTYNYETDEWSYTVFDTREELADFVESIFKEPGQYEFDECSEKFNAEGRKFNKHRVYCLAPERSKDFVNYWNTEKDKCRKKAQRDALRKKYGDEEYKKLHAKKIAEQRKKKNIEN